MEITEYILKKQKICQRGTTKSASPSAQSTLINASEAFAMRDLEPKNYEVQNQMDSQISDQTDKFQQKKPKGQIQHDVLLNLHQELGNKWTEIACRLIGWDHNSVKNYFYAKIRKSLRRINLFATKFLSQKIKQLNMSHVSKMITTLSDKNSEDSFIHSKQFQINQIKRFLFGISERNQQDVLTETQSQQLKGNILKIYDLIQQVKKKCTSTKKNKKKQERNNEKASKIIRQSTTIKSAKRQTEKSLNSEEPRNYDIIQNPMGSQIDANNQTYWIMFMPYQQYNINQNLLEYPQNLYSWVNHPQNFNFLDSNIFGNS